MYPSKRGIKTLLIAEYASWDFPDGGRPGNGLGNAVMKVLKAVEGIEVSTECVVLMFETL